VKARFTLALLAVALLALVPPASAQADPTPPTHNIVLIDRTFTDTTCPFPLTEHIEGQQVTTLFFNEEGQVERRLRQIIVSATLTNPDTGTMIVAGVHQAVVFDRDFTTGTLAQHGLRLVVTVPGMGVVLLDAGTFVTDAAGNVVFEAGPHQLLHGDVAEFCAAMS
jgi:hypothetical protein